MSRDITVSDHKRDNNSPWQRGTNENTVSVGRGPVGLIGQAGAGSLR
jgi:hypothetical protein